MKNERIQLEVVTPERAVLTDEVDEVVLPGERGEMSIRPGHIPLLTSLDIGEMVVRDGQNKRSFVVVRGFAEILSDRVRVLAQECEGVDEIDKQEARSKLAEAQDGIRDLQEGEVDEEDDQMIEKYRESLKKARTQLMLSDESDALDE